MNARAGETRHAVGENQYRRARPLLGTLVEISARGPNAALAVERAFATIDEVQRLMSYHDADSEVSRVNREAVRHAVTVSPHTYRVLQAACTFAQASDGLFDITVAPTLAALGFLPRYADFPRASGQGDWRHVQLLPGGRVRLARRVCIDLGGIAKGYAVDRAIEALKTRGMRAARVNAGGDLRLFGAAPQAIHVRRPGAPTALLPLMEMREGAAATSADYFSARRVRGRWVSSLIHPRTRACCPRGRSVTVLAPDCLSADALTKVVHADPERALAVLARFSARALMLQEGDGVGRAYTFNGQQAPLWQTRWLPGDADRA